MRIIFQIELKVPYCYTHGMHAMLCHTVWERYRTQTKGNRSNFVNFAQPDSHSLDRIFVPFASFARRTVDIHEYRFDKRPPWIPAHPNKHETQYADAKFMAIGQMGIAFYTYPYTAHL